ncbi:E3 ubiquitin-protein ligase MBR1-like [Coffea eugenioides]|uniref:E3 ubiquitin-protein ligase MBR1-like n=1 Tax=Coffea eugenioides TaxID=49369 RepID=UPI000F614381|nr:E3 ubiquitin-protein ligase MBR1-like [Coffea eugenioides]
MTPSIVEEPKARKPTRKKPNAASDFNHSQFHCSIQSPNFPDLQRSKSPSRNGTTESREPLISQKPKKMFLLARLGGLGCKGTSTRVSESTIIRSAADWETEKRRRKNLGNRPPSKARIPDNVAVDVPDICCTPPGISFASDVVPRPSMTTQRTTHVQHSRVARRTRNIQHFSASSSQGPSNSIFSRDHSFNARQYHQLGQYSHRGFIEVFALFERSLDQYMDWRLNLDRMSYEELLELSDEIGYVGRGLSEEDIFSCLTILEPSDFESAPLLMSLDEGWRCTICQEECKAKDDVGRLGCGHCHHIDCIKQWLKQKNQCPVCKIAPIADK